MIVNQINRKKAYHRVLEFVLQVICHNYKRNLFERDKLDDQLEGASDTHKDRWNKWCLLQRSCPSIQN